MKQTRPDELDLLSTRNCVLYAPASENVRKAVHSMRLAPACTGPSADAFSIDVQSKPSRRCTSIPKPSLWYVTTRNQHRL